MIIKINAIRLTPSTIPNKNCTPLIIDAYGAFPL